jgi:hypothetical protein
VLDRKLLSIYLNDHLAGSTVGVELARRTLGSNSGSPYGDFLEWLVAQIEGDRAALVELMDELGVRQDHVKVVAGWGLEKAGRLKCNGRLKGYSPLSRLVELEGLWAGVEGKRSMWRVLLTVAEADSRLDRGRLQELEARAEEQLRRLDEHRSPVARDAFTS